MTQFSLFGAAVAEPTLDDLDGVLLAGGHWVRSGTARARLSVVVSDRWRADALVDEFQRRGLECPPGEVSVTPAETGLGVRTGFHRALAELAGAWYRGTTVLPPPGFQLTPGGLRLWAIAAGRADDHGYRLATAEPDGPLHTAGGAQLARLGLAGVSIGHRSDPGWRVTSAKRLRRLAELLGEPPADCGPDWPTA
jgi:hypothetical protein